MKHKRNPGGQPGNQNARKHGFYSQALTPELLALMGPTKQLDGVDLELALARAKVKSIVANDPKNYAVLFDALSVIGRLGAIKTVLVNIPRGSFPGLLKLSWRI